MDMDTYQWPVSTNTKLTDSATFIINLNNLPKYISKTVNPTFDIHLTILRNLTGSTIAIITSKDFENGSTEIEVTPISVKAEFSIHDNQSNAYINNNNYYWVDNTFYNQHKHQLGVLEKSDDCISISLLTTLDENIKQLAILLLLSSVIYQERSTRTKKFKWPTIKHKPLAKVG